MSDQCENAWTYLKRGTNTRVLRVCYSTHAATEIARRVCAWAAGNTNERRHGESSRSPGRARRADDATARTCSANPLDCDQTRPAYASARPLHHDTSVSRRTVDVTCPCSGEAGELSRISKGRSKGTDDQVYLSHPRPGSLPGYLNKVASEAGNRVVDNE